MIRNGIILGVGYGFMKCFLERSFTVIIFLQGIYLLLATIAVEGLLSIAVYFLGRKIPWVSEHRKIALLGISGVILVLVVMIAIVLP